MKALKKSNCIAKNYRFKIFPQFSTSINHEEQSGKQKSKVDIENVNLLSKYSNEWWNPYGQVAPLHAMNRIRIPFLRDGLINAGFKVTNPSRPLEGLKLLDVGSGGGILSEPLARLGAKVTGIDASKELIALAKEHAALDKDISKNLTYKLISIEDFSMEVDEEYDAVIASEIIEHVIDPELFLKSCVKVLKPKGSIFITTFNRNLASWITGIVTAEYILKIVPLGTHNWNKFVTPEETRQLLEKYNCKTKLVHGTIYNPFLQKWSWTSLTTIMYALHAVKQDTEKKN